MVFECPVLRTRRPHEWQVSRVAFHPSLNIVASASWDRTVQLYDVDEDKVVRTLPRGTHKAPIIAVAWHPSGGILASGSADNTTVLWDAATGSKLQTLREHFGWIMDCSFSPDKTRLATASWDKTLRLWDCASGALISTLNGHTKGVASCRFYPVGQSSALLASVGEDMRLWDTRNGKVALTMTGTHADALLRLAWSADGNTLALSSADTTISIWDAKAGKMLRQLKGHADAVKDIAFSTDPQGDILLASAGGDSAVLWDLQTGGDNQLCDLRQHDPGKEVETVSISFDNTILATGGRDGKLVFHKLPTLPKEQANPSKWGRQHTSLDERRTTFGKSPSVLPPSLAERRTTLGKTAPSLAAQHAGPGEAPAGDAERRTTFPRGFSLVTAAGVPAAGAPVPGDTGTMGRAPRADARAQLQKQQEEAWMAALDEPVGQAKAPEQARPAVQKNPQAHLNRMITFMARSESTTADPAVIETKPPAREMSTVEAMMEASSKPRFTKNSFRRVDGQ